MVGGRVSSLASGRCASTETRDVATVVKQHEQERVRVTFAQWAIPFAPALDRSC